MRRPARRLFTLCSAVSLLLCMAAIMLWVRSLHWVDFAVVEFPGREVRLWTNPQLLALGLASPANEDSDWDNGIYSGDLGAWHFRWRQPMPGFERELSGSVAVTVPLWCLVLGLAILPGMVGVRRLQQRARARDGLCTQCGYDLRATPGRCPECGTAAAAAATAEAPAAPPG